MDAESRRFIMQVMDGAVDLTLATVRPDGYPQATTVSYAHDGLDLYVGIGRHSQKAENIRQSNKVSLTINLPYDGWNQIRGLSMAAVARLLDGQRDREAIAVARSCLLARFPQLARWAEPGAGPPVADITFLHITPQTISLLDYTQGFGHTELVSV